LIKTVVPNSIGTPYNPLANDGFQNVTTGLNVMPPVTQAGHSVKSSALNTGILKKLYS
jgi:hypothetical protein